MSKELDISVPVVIFCGGQGTRMRGGTLTKKELVEIGGRPIIWHVMRLFSAYGFQRFVLPLGYEAHQIKRYFLNYEAMGRDFTIQVGRPHPQIDYHGVVDHPVWDVSLIDTGIHTDKASRVYHVRQHLTAERFFVTYGDGVGDVDIEKLMAFHKAHGKLVTITAVQPQRYQYGVIHAQADGSVTEYEQYPEIDHWINAGFMVFERSVLEEIGEGDDVALETGVIPRLIAQNQVMVYRHGGFWQSMDTLKDARDLEQRWQEDAPWRVW